jgi:hypothetical protein
VERGGGGGGGGAGERESERAGGRERDSAREEIEAKRKASEGGREEWRKAGQRGRRGWGWGWGESGRERTCRPLGVRMVGEREGEEGGTNRQTEAEIEGDRENVLMCRPLCHQLLGPAWGVGRGGE